MICFITALVADPSHEHKKCVEVKVHREGTESRITASVRECTEVSGGWPAGCFKLPGRQ